MRKVIYGGAVSADLYLAGPGEAMDWLRWSDEAAAISAESFRGADTMLMGRKTWEFAQRMGGGPPLKGVTSFVFSRTLDDGEFRARTSPGRSAPEFHGRTSPGRSPPELVREDVADFVRRLKAQAGGPSTGLGTGNIVVMGGGELGSALLEAGLVDEIGMNVHPLLLGGGTPLFRPLTRRVEMELIETRPIARECVLMRYRVPASWT